MSVCRKPVALGTVIRSLTAASRLPDIRRARVPLGACAAALTILSGAAIAGHSHIANNGEEPLIEFSSDEPVSADHHLTESVSFGALIEIEAESEFNFDLDRADKEDSHEVLPKLNLAFAYEPDPVLRAFVDFQLSHNLIFDDRDDADEEIQLMIIEAYLTFRDIEHDIALTVGRHDRSDEREWLMDEELDGVELTLRHNALALEFSYGRKRLFRGDLLHDDDRKRPDFYMARAFHAIGEDSQVSAFTIYQDGHEGRTNEDLLFLGVQSFGELGSGIDFWADGATVIGDDAGRDVLGFGLDVGIVKTFKDLPMQPYLTFAGAFGTGDDGSGDDGAFRQTGLQGNSDHFGGVTSVQYYGEALDPELSNLAILTLGAGVRPTRRSSLDLVYHRYWQHKPSDDVRDSRLDADPEGERRHLGDGFDIVIGTREIEPLDLELVGGVFLPSRTFEKRDPAFFAGLTVQVKF